MQKTDHLKYLPTHFTEDDKINYELLCNDAKGIFKKIKDDWLIHIAVLAYINEEKGYGIVKDDRDIENEMSKYDLSNSNLVLETPFDSCFNMEKTMKEIIQPEISQE
jgi:hypothetical protein